MSRTMHSRTLALILVAGVTISCSDAVTSPPGGPSRKHDDASESAELASPRWQAQARTLVGMNSFSPYAAGRAYAAVSVAQYAAVVDADGDDPSGHASADLRRGAVAGASFETLKFLFPLGGANVDALLASESAAGGIEAQERFAHGLAIGRAAGLTQVARARTDGFTTPWTGTVPVGEGIWAPTPPSTGPAGSVLIGTLPYLLSSSDQFRSEPPPAYGSPAFELAMDTIRLLTSQRTPEQQAVVIAWNLSGGTHTPPGRWNLAAADRIIAYGLDERDATHVFAVMHVAMMDSQIACWDSKMTYWVVRPSQAGAGVSLGLSVPNHPSYPSGHSCLSAAAGAVLTRFFHEDRKDLAADVAEAGISRMLAGIHFGFDVKAGQDIGDAIGKLAIKVDRHDGLLNAIRYQ
jgi:hypothetical protein